MHFPGSSLLGAVRQKLRKIPAVDLQYGEGASPGFPTDYEPGISDVPETIALATPSPSIDPRGIHEIVSPFIDSEDSKPGRTAREAEGPDLQASPSDQTDMADQAGDELVADIRANSEAVPSDQTDMSGQLVHGLEAAIKAPAAPEFAEKGAFEGPIGKSSPDSENGITALRELFAKNAVVNPAVKGLLDRHHPVNTRTLNRELKEFARQLGLSPPNE